MDIGVFMAVTQEQRSKLIKDFQRNATDSGSPEVQIALLTARINDLTDHFKTHTKDHASRRGLLKMVSTRRSLLDYLKKIDPQRYLDVIKRLDIRK
jgi:small subunit ribosomal protein S15